ncbi:MAG: hypothetical protein RBU30_14555 [Polyangia bacterium]|nr:hypothetical protein [Polyangia bacterium]
MTAVLVMVGDVLAQQQQQQQMMMIRVDHHDVVEDLAADGQHPSLSDTVLLCLGDRGEITTSFTPQTRRV